MCFPKSTFEEMNQLSLQKKAFFFVVDFLKENILLFDENQLEKELILVDFPNFKNFKNFKKKSKKINWESHSVALEEYKKAFDKVQNEIKKGESYLCNLTCRSTIKTDGTLLDFFTQSQAKYKVLLPENWVFFSPETFISIHENKIRTEPMKGTIDASLPNAKEILLANAKENAEHYTVIDLLRNDLSRVANEVGLQDFKRIDYLQTAQKNLFAMSSCIEGRLKPEFENKIGSILDAMLPAGSILGAPKAQTLKIIKNSETYSRGFYTGVSGYFDGENLDSCVMIRFLEKENEVFYFKSGGGITHQSDCLSEYDEMKKKIYVPIY